jgi:Domain of unknown function (DUF6285)
MDKPSAIQLLDAVSAYLRDELVPALDGAEAFKARVAANALDLARREWTDGAAAKAEDGARLRALLGRDGSFDELNRALCDTIRDGRMTLATPGLAAHLWKSTLAKMAIDQPSYASYRRVLEELEKGRSLP